MTLPFGESRSAVACVTSATWDAPADNACARRRRVRRLGLATGRVAVAVVWVAVAPGVVAVV
jgi:hypothetical protein